MPDRPVRVLRSIARTVLFLGLLVAACIDGQVRKLLFGLRPGPDGAVWVHHWCRRIVRALGIACTVTGPLPACDSRSLAIVSNHLSYLDILVASAATPCIMVAKSELRAWPMLGWITAQAGTVYVQRADVKGGRTQTHAEVNALMAEAFRSGLPVLFYPEGTTTDGATILPFRRGLFHSVLHAQAEVRTAAIAYNLSQTRSGLSVANDVCFWGDMNFVPHLFNCLGLEGLAANMQFSPGSIPGEDRFALAQNSRSEVAVLYKTLHPVRHAPASIPEEELLPQPCGDLARA